MQATTIRKEVVKRNPIMVANGWIAAVAVGLATVRSTVAAIADQNPS